MENKKNSKSSGGFFQSLFGGLFGKHDAESENRKKIKAIAKKYSKCRYNKFYKFNGNEITPTFAKLFYDVYKIVGPAQKIFESYKNQNIYRKIVISASIPEDLKTIEDSISEENINKLASQIPLKNLKTQLEERLTKYNDYFSAERIAKIELLHKQLMVFKEFCSFDFFFMLKKFNKNLTEGAFPQSVQFDKINGEYIADDLKDFTDIVYSIPDNCDWAPLFDVLKIMRGNCPISLNVWKKVVSKMLSIKYSGALPMMVQLLTNDPSFAPKEMSIPSIVQPYLDNLRTESTNAINKLLKAEKQQKTTSSIGELFGNKSVELLKYYTEEGGKDLKAKQLTPFKYCSALNYMKAFMIYFVKTDLHNFYDIIIVRGKWESPALCTPVSNSYHSLTMVADKITAFDEELNVMRPTGMKIKNLMPKASRDNTSRNIINRVVGEANDAANECILTSLKSIIIIGKVIKSLIDDLNKSKPEMLTNWKEVEHFCEEPVKEFLVGLYKKIYLFTTLIQSCLKEEV